MMRKRSTPAETGRVRPRLASYAVLALGALLGLGACGSVPDWKWLHSTLSGPATGGTTATLDQPARPARPALENPDRMADAAAADETASADATASLQQGDEAKRAEAIGAPRPAVSITTGDAAVALSELRSDAPPKHEPLAEKQASSKIAAQGGRARRAARGQAVSGSASSTPTAALPTRSDDAASLIKWGDQYLKTGDIVAARSFYERAVAEGSHTAATRIGRTFDPAFLADLGVHGLRGDPAKAAFWYAKASEAGDSEATQRLKVLNAELR